MKQQRSMKTNMTHFRGQIRGPHWGHALDNMLIDFWRKHECLFNSSANSYYDRDLKTKLWSEFASSIGKCVSDVERRARSLRTQYGRVLYHPERVSTAQQKMLKDKLDFLRPYIVRRRGDTHSGERFDDGEEDNEELETEGSIDQEMGSLFVNSLDADATEQDDDDDDDDDDDRRLDAAPLCCASPQPQDTEVISLSCPQEDHPNAIKHDLLDQFAKVVVADMRYIKDPMVLLKLRRDITDLVFKAVEEDVQRRRAQAPSSVSRLAENTRSQQPCAQTDLSRRQRFLKRKNKEYESERRVQTWQEMGHTRRTSRSQLSSQAVHHGCSSQDLIQSSEIKREPTSDPVKTEDEVPPLA